MSMATITQSSSSLLHFLSPPPSHSPTSPRRLPSKLFASSDLLSASATAAAPLNPVIIDKSSLILAEATSDEQLLAATCLRVRSFYEFKHDSFSPEDYKKYLVEREFKGLKERVAGDREGFRKVSCINASLPLSHVSSLSEDLCATCKFPHNGEQQVVVGTLDLNQCVKLPDEMAGMKPQGIGTDFARAYLSNVCVAKELHKNGLGFALISKAKSIADQWGISDLYIHVAIDNEPAKKLYYKSGFVYENAEAAWEARFLNRPRRLLLWLGLPHRYNL
ncbi:GCN5-related N-acetyltransferase 7, chloroplastic [Silene latifolia]|uniref:GCN5-related N-acetyltransferase 7, chloroplastic n=1 Tax=Silene latifolia TaxID=37657 RepID=UPI003D7741D1